MKHYVVIFDGATPCLGSVIEISGIAHSLKKAKEILAKASEDEKEYAKENGFVIRADTDDEFDAGEDGNYEEEHAHFYIREVV